MKTAHEWMQIEQTDGHPHILCPSIIRAIQLDAMKEGARKAMGIVDAQHYSDESCTRSVTLNVAERAIMHATANWTEADL